MCAPAWDGNGTCEYLITLAWPGRGGERMLIAVNDAEDRRQCDVPLPFTNLGGKTWRQRVLLGPATYDRDGLETRGLVPDVEPMTDHASGISSTCSIGVSRGCATARRPISSRGLSPSVPTSAVRPSLGE